VGRVASFFGADCGQAYLVSGLVNTVHISQSMHNTKQNRDNSQTLESAKTKPKRVGIFSESPILYISEYAGESETCWDLSGFCSSNFMLS